jgi:hypothetical protein
MIQPLAPGRCHAALTYLYGNLLDLEDAHPGENWTPLRRLVANEPSIRRCAPRRARPHGHGALQTYTDSARALCGARSLRRTTRSTAYSRPCQSPGANCSSPPEGRPPFARSRSHFRCGQPRDSASHDPRILRDANYAGVAAVVRILSTAALPIGEGSGQAGVVTP